jgi:hypothetical protein
LYVPPQLPLLPLLSAPSSVQTSTEAIPFSSTFLSFLSFSILDLYPYIFIIWQGYHLCHSPLSCTLTAPPPPALSSAPASTIHDGKQCLSIYLYPYETASNPTPCYLHTHRVNHPPSFPFYFPIFYLYLFQSHCQLEHQSSERIVPPRSFILHVTINFRRLTIGSNPSSYHSLNLTSTRSLIATASHRRIPHLTISW